MEFSSVTRFVKSQCLGRCSIYFYEMYTTRRNNNFSVELERLLGILEGFCR